MVRRREIVVLVQQQEEQVSKRERHAGSKLMFCDADFFGLYRPHNGLAAAKMEARVGVLTTYYGPCSYDDTISAKE